MAIYLLVAGSAEQVKPVAAFVEAQIFSGVGATRASQRQDKAASLLPANSSMMNPKQENGK